VVLDDVFGSVNARGGYLDTTIERLIAAAESGKRSGHCRRDGHDRAAARRGGFGTN
jgi:hypothetical protein